nr:DNA gyrase subunit A [Chloroflexota bacterium]
LLLFSARGQVYGLPVHRIGTVAKRSDKGAAAGALVDLAVGDHIVAAVAVSDTPPPFLVFATKGGQVKRAATGEYTGARGAGIAALRLDEGDELVAVDTSDGESDVLLSTRQGKAIRFKEDEVRPTGRVAGAMRGIKLDDGDEALGGPLVVTPRLPLVATFSDTGYARRTPLDDYPVQGRGGGGVKAMPLGGKGGKSVNAVLFVTKGGDFECTVDAGTGPKVAVVDGADIPVADRAKIGVQVTEPILAVCPSLGSVR